MVNGLQQKLLNPNKLRRILLGAVSASQAHIPPCICPFHRLLSASFCRPISVTVSASCRGFSLCDSRFFGVSAFE
jgi:hypothetical protein